MRNLKSVVVIKQSSEKETRGEEKERASLNIYMKRYKNWLKNIYKLYALKRFTLCYRIICIQNLRDTHVRKSNCQCEW